jgi:diguanylate cyclase
MARSKAPSKSEPIAEAAEFQALLDAVAGELQPLELVNFPLAVNLGVWHWHCKTNSYVCDDSRLRVLGYGKKEMPAAMSWEFFADKLHPEDDGKAAKSMQSLLKGKAPAYEATYRIRTKDGRWAWHYEWGRVTARDKAGKPKLVSGISFDISEQKQMEELLHKQSRQLREMGTVDPLTNTFNRRALFEKLEYEMKRAKRSKNPLCLLVLDIDHFKEVNDTRGHLAGDKVLTGVASVIKTTVRNTDIVGRFAGKEFIVILPDCSLKDGVKVAEMVRLSVQAAKFEAGLTVTLSGGIKAYRDESSDQLIEAADILLAKAKDAGCNRIQYSR